ncbi:MAG: hypothetical protein GY698_15170 [Actinomycetia bacterium]|nr:hypothetical protein [Actinomycetes bacterium]
MRDYGVERGRTPVEQVWVGVSVPPQDLRREITFELARNEVEVLVATGQHGTVTEVHVGSGDTLFGTGPAPYSVDGVARPWFEALAPLFRPIGRSDLGGDVDMLGTWLQGQGYDPSHEAGEPVSRSFVLAIQNWAEDHGLDRTASFFDPGWVTWLPESMAGETVVEVEVVAGAPAPAGGQSVLTIGGEIIAASPEEAGSERGSLQLAEMKTFLLIGGQEVEYSGGPVPSGVVAWLEDQVHPDQSTVTLTLIDRFADDVVAVPASSLFPLAPGEACVVVGADGSGTHPEAAIVEIVGGQSGMSFLRGASGFVLSNPAQVGGGTCR